MSAPGSFDGAPERGTINFSVGQPSADLLPLKLLASGGERFFADAAPFDLNYGQRQGDARFRAALAAFLAQSSGTPVDPDSLMLTGGISQGLDFVCGRLAKAGDVVFVEEPSYPYSFQIFRDHGLEIVGVPVDAAGMDIDRFERLLAQHRPTLVYTIPAFHNPTGRVLDRARRDRLIALSREHGFTIVADEVYQLLYHGAPPPPSFGTLGAAGNVLSLGTFSKILAPGLRLGWIQTTPALMQRLLSSGALVSGGNFNHFTSHLVRKLMESGELAAFVESLRARYAERAQAMDSALRKHLSGVARWEKPGGGYFFWLELPEGADASALEAGARAAGTGFLPGSACSMAGGQRHCLRLSFAHYSVPDIHEGIARLQEGLRPVSATTEPTGTLDVAMKHAEALLAKRPELAAEQAREILKVVPRHAPAAFLLARASARIGRGDEAIAALRRTVKLQPDHPEAWRLLADHLAAIGDAEGADAAYLRHVKASTRNPELLQAAGAMVKKDLPRAEALLKAHLMKAPTDVPAIRMLAEVAARLGRDDDAIKLLERCLELAPNFTPALYNYAVLLHRRNESARALAGHRAAARRRSRAIRAIATSTPCS